MNDILKNEVLTAQVRSRPSGAPLSPVAHVITSDDEAIQVALTLAEEFAAGAAERDRHRLLPHEEIERFSQSGLGGITVPRAYGGAAVSFVTMARVFAILSAADPSIGQIPQNHFGFINVIAELGSESQKQRYFAGVLAGKRLGNAGPERNTRDTTDIRARLTAENGTLRVSGQKYYSTGALFAHWVPTKVLDDEGRLVVVIAERGTDGLTVIDDWSGFGQRTTASGTVNFDRVVIDPDAVLPLWQTLDQPSYVGSVSQLIQAAIDAGIARAAVSETVRFLKSHARPWVDAAVARATDDPYVIRDAGVLHIELHAAEAVLERAAKTLDRLRKNGIDAASQAEASIAVAKAKALTTEIALTAAEKLFELSGSRAVLSAHNLDRHWRNARVHTLHDPVRWKYHAIGNEALNGTPPPRHSWI